MIINLLFAVLYGADFGDSYDENARYEKGLETLASFKQEGPTPGIRDKGSIYFVTAILGGDLIRQLNPDLSAIQSWHYVHFASFILALIAFYSICLNFLDPTEAFLTTALFNTQPLLFGHAFINPKDIPFMAFFILTIAAGLEMIKKYPISPSQTDLSKSLTSIWQEFKTEWSELSGIKKILFPILILSSSMILVPILWKEGVQEWIVTSVNNVRISWITSILDKIAWVLFKGNVKNGISLYKIGVLFPKIMASLIVFTILYVIVLLIIFIPKSLKSFLGFSSRKEFLNDLSITLRNPWLYLSGFILGFSTSNRTIGFAAGFFILFYAWLRFRSILVPMAISYLGIGIFILYISRPELWENPLIALFNSLLENTTFIWSGRVFFGGEYYFPKELPIRYFPTLLGIQLTIPALVLIILGLIVYFINKKEYQLDTTLFLIFLIWFGVPFLAILLLKPSIYDNFRHFLFIIPPLFLFAGLGIKFIRSKINSRLLIGVLIIITFLPGILGIINLHPYQYIYYNEFVGGINGADRNFLTDYWYTSYRDSILYLNNLAEPNANILVTGPEHIILSYAREDLNVIKYQTDIKEEQFLLSDYLITGSRKNLDQTLFSEEEIIYSIEEGGVVLSIIRKINQ